MVEGLELTRARGIRRVRIFVDSELLVDQLHERAKVKATQIINLHDRARSLLQEYSDWRMSWVPRAWNKEADLLATAALVESRSKEGPPEDASSATAAPSPTEQLPTIDAEGQAAWISEHTDLPREPIERVLDLQFEFLVAVGIVDLPDYRLKYYSADELQGVGQIVDSQRLAQDAERLLNIPSEIASEILDAEHQFLRMRGLAD